MAQFTLVRIESEELQGHTVQEKVGVGEEALACLTSKNKKRALGLTGDVGGRPSSHSESGGNWSSIPGRFADGSPESLNVCSFGSANSILRIFP